MATVYCVCGHSMYDGSDYLSFKARFIADQDTSAANDAYLSEIKLQVMNAFQKPDVNWDELVETIQWLVMREQLEYERTFYQCENCGRLLIPDQDRKKPWHIFTPENQNPPYKLLHSIQGDNWKGFVRAETMGNIQFLSWYTNAESGGKQIDDWETLEKEYYEVFNRLREKNIIQYSYLKKGAEIIHRWSLEDDQ